MRVYQHNVLPSAPAGMVVDLTLCFAAVILAASTLTSRYMTISDAVPELPLILFGATLFSLVMALMYALVGLYRPKTISASAKTIRTVLAICVGGYLTSLTLRIVADRGYIEQLIPAAIAYLAVGLVLSRGCFYVMQRVTTLPSVLIIGTGAEAQAIAEELRAPECEAGQVTTNADCRTVRMVFALAEIVLGLYKPTAHTSAPLPMKIEWHRKVSAEAPAPHPKSSCTCWSVSMQPK